MKITTSKQNEHDVIWIMGPTQITGNLVILMQDERKLSEVCREFEDLEWIKTDDGQEWNGFTEIAVASRPGKNDVRLSLTKAVV